MARRTRHNPFTEEQKQFILDNYQSKSVAQLSVEMGLTQYIDRRIYAFLTTRGLASLDTSRKRKSSLVNAGFFDVNEKENWAI